MILDRIYAVYRRKNEDSSSLFFCDFEVLVELLFDNLLNPIKT